MKYCPVCGATQVLNMEIEIAKALVNSDIREYGCKACKHGGIISIEENYVEEEND